MTRRSHVADRFELSPTPMSHDRARRRRALRRGVSQAMTIRAQQVAVAGLLEKPGQRAIELGEGESLCRRIAMMEFEDSDGAGVSAVRAVPPGCVNELSLAQQPSLLLRAIGLGVPLTPACLPQFLRRERAERCSRRVVCAEW